MTEVVTSTTQEHGEIVAEEAALPRCTEQRTDGKGVCGKVKDSFACRIRHIQINTGFAKAYEEN